MYIDAHIHLSSDVFDNTIEEVLQRAYEVGVRSVCNVVTNPKELLKSLDYAQRFSFIDFKHIAGKPPQDVYQASEAELTFFTEYAEKGVLSAIGEIGLDYHKNITCEEKEKQKELLISYIHLALSMNLPIIVHCRNAFKDFFSILERYYNPYDKSRRGMLHCFTGNEEEARQLIEYGWLISISGIVSFKNSQNLRDVVIKLPLENLVIETDAPWLAPVPMRGKINEPSFLIYTFNVVGALKNLSLDELSLKVRTNLQEFFK